MLPPRFEPPTPAKFRSQEAGALAHYAITACSKFKSISTISTRQKINQLSDGLQGQEGTKGEKSLIW